MERGRLHDGGGGRPAPHQPGDPCHPSGDREWASFDALVREHSPFLLKLARSLAPTVEVDPEDMVQDTLERAWRSRDSFRGESSTRAWLCAILTNRVRDLARSRVRFFDRSWRIYHAELACQRLAENTEELIARAEDEEELRRALTALPYWERAAVLLHDCALLPAYEVAVVLGCSTEAAHKRIQRGRVRLAAELSHRSRRPKGVPRPAPRTCRVVRRLLPSYLEGDLPETERSAIEAHIAACPHCPALVQALWALLSILAGGTGVSEDVVVRFQIRAKALADETLEGDPPAARNGGCGNSAASGA